MMISGSLLASDSLMCHAVIAGQGSKVTVGLPKFFNQVFPLMKNSSQFDVLVGIDANMKFSCLKFSFVS